MRQRRALVARSSSVRSIVGRPGINPLRNPDHHGRRQRIQLRGHVGIPSMGNEVHQPAGCGIKRHDHRPIRTALEQQLPRGEIQSPLGLFPAVTLETPIHQHPAHLRLKHLQPVGHPLGMVRRQRSARRDGQQREPVKNQGQSRAKEAAHEMDPKTTRHQKDGRQSRAGENSREAERVCRCPACGRSRSAPPRFAPAFPVR